MDSFNLAYKRDEEESKWLELLKAFNDIHQNDRTFVDKFGLLQKKQFTLNLFDILQTEIKETKRSNVAILQTLIALRISLREIPTDEESIVLQNLNLFIKFGNIGEDNKTTMYSDEIREEALKSTINSIVKSQSIHNKFVNELNGPVLITRELKKGADDKVSMPIYKILIHCCTRVEVRAKVLGEGLLDHVADQMEARTTGNFEASVILGDLFRLMFTSTMHLGPLDSGSHSDLKVTEADYARLRRLFPTFKKIFTYHCNATHQMYSIKLALVSTLLNTPKDLFDELVDEIQLTYFEQILATQLESYDKPEAPGDIIPILMLLSCIAENVPQTRDPLKAFTFPHELIKETDEPLSISVEAPKESVSQGISARLIPLMTSSDIGLKHFSAEYFYNICDQDPNELCRLTGYGNAAGLLVTKGLMALGGK
ncbi:hypothetical protein SAMD00019534_064960, partial [Acytostelium subglobosum LB1]|uniref:hypothetical protein n=1 Tax=Acytostelium subglobosum LB1 TaxID=1410327 RepID=UPI000644856B